MPKIAAIVLTYNEERHLPDCLASLQWCDEVWVIDSYSTDRTVEIARQFTPHVLQNPFQDFSAQRNWALDNIASEAEWVLMVDADEIVPPELALEIRERLEEDEDRYGGYYIPFAQYFWGKLLKHTSAARLKDLFLFRRGRYRFQDRLVHEEVVPDFPTASLTARMVHISWGSLWDALQKINRYTSLEALRMYENHEELYPPKSKSHFRRNQVLKQIFARSPAKPLTTFLYNYILLQGFRDGREGFAWCMLQTLYVWASYFKTWELRQRRISPEQVLQQTSAHLPILEHKAQDEVR